MADPADLRTLHARVTGRVQGVGFRAWTCDVARSLGLAGWVKNEPDGAVATLVRGPAGRVGEFLALLEQGPPAARVTAVATEPGEAPPGLTGFRIVW
jgi:acylphosphatase